VCDYTRLGLVSCARGDEIDIEIHGYVAARIYSIYIVHDLLTALRERARGPRGGRRRAALRRVLPVVAPCSGFASLFAHIHASLHLLRVSALATRLCACYASLRLLRVSALASSPLSGASSSGAHFFL
jgi:hypothetical protein